MAVDKMWDVLRFLKSPQSETSEELPGESKKAKQQIDARLVEAFRATLASPMVKGFAVGRTIFAHSARLWLAGSMSDEKTIANMANRFEELTSA